VESAGADPVQSRARAVQDGRPNDYAENFRDRRLGHRARNVPKVWGPAARSRSQKTGALLVADDKVAHLADQPTPGQGTEVRELVRTQKRHMKPK
jgi:hypothetical protein